MLNTEAVYSFFSSFGMPVYVIGAVPDVKEITYPYITYESAVASRGNAATTNVSVWFLTKSEREMNEIIAPIIKAAADGVNIACEGGSVFIYSNEPWESMLDVESDAITRKNTTFTIVFNTI